MYAKCVKKYKFSGRAATHAYVIECSDEYYPVAADYLQRRARSKSQRR